jgi:hypothetical protein
MVTLFVVAYSKFVDGAWIVIVLIPAIVMAFRAVNNHYKEIAHELTLADLSAPPTEPMPAPRVVVPISGVHRGVVEALRYARSISDRVTAVYVEINPGDGERVRERWAEWGQGVPLVVVSSPYRSIVGPILEYLEQVDQESDDGQLASIVLPEFVPVRWWQHLLHNQTAWLLKLALLYGRRRQGKVRAIIDIPMYLRR